MSLLGCDAPQSSTTTPTRPAPSAQVSRTVAQSPTVSSPDPTAPTPNNSGTPDASLKLPPAITQAFIKTQALENVRYEITSEVSFTRSGETIRQMGLSAHGEERGEDRHLAISGVMNSTGDVVTYEFITLDGMTYARGLNGLPGINPAQWYRMGQELGNVTRDAPSVKTLLADLEIREFQKTAFHQAGTETVDKLECVVWKAENPKLGQGFIGIANNREAAAQLKEVDHAEFSVWICVDGYIHRITGEVAGHDPANTRNKASVGLKFSIFDQNAPITITAPANAKEFQLSIQGATPTNVP